jgi:putative spermidine/putrescine transport system permease protein
LILSLPLGLFFAAFVVAPLAMLVLVSLYNDATLTGMGLRQYLKFFSDRFNVDVLISTLWLGARATLLALLLGYPLALLYTAAPRRWQGVLLLLVLLPLLTSSVVRTFAWVVILGRQGIVNSVLLDIGLIADPLKLLYTPWAVVVALAQIELPLMVLPLITALANLDPNLAQASRSLGAGHWRTFLQVTFPLSAPGLLAGCLLVFASSVSAFVTQSLVGGGQQIYMPFFMYQQAIEAGNYPFAAAVAVLLLISVMAVATVINVIGRRSKGFIHV